MTIATIGQVGLGTLGKEFVPRLKAQFGALAVHDRDPARVAEARQHGAAPAASAREVGERVDCVLLSLPDPDAVRAVLTGADGVFAGARVPRLVIDTTTSDPETARAMAALASARGAVFVEAPVSTPIHGVSGVEAARMGQATFIVGAPDEAAFQAAHAVLRPLAKHVFHVGPVGQGSAMKLVTNYVAGATRVALAEGLALAAAMGVPGARALDICRHAAAGSQTLEEFDRKYFKGDIEETSFSIDLRYKDFRLASELARQMGVPMFLNGVIVELYQMMRAQGLGGKDVNIIGPYMASLAGVDLEAGGRRA